MQTYGDGKFESIYSQDYGQTILDPLPHDKTYFENHLKFVQNYYKKVSNGKLNVSYTVLDNILTVSKTMRNYTPDIDDINNLTPVAEYLKEVWTLADVKYPNFNYEDYDLFLVFHAGVGKDISLPGSLGNERDLPSVYMNDNSLKNVSDLISLASQLGIVVSKLQIVQLCPKQNRVKLKGLMEFLWWN